MGSSSLSSGRIDGVCQAFETRNDFPAIKAMRLTPMMMNAHFSRVLFQTFTE